VVSSWACGYTCYSQRVLEEGKARQRYNHCCFTFVLELLSARVGDHRVGWVLV